MQLWYWKVAVSADKFVAEQLCCRRALVWGVPPASMEEVDSIGTRTRGHCTMTISRLYPPLIFTPPKCLIFTPPISRRGELLRSIFLCSMILSSNSVCY